MRPGRLPLLVSLCAACGAAEDPPAAPAEARAEPEEEVSSQARALIDAALAAAPAGVTFSEPFDDEPPFRDHWAKAGVFQESVALLRRSLEQDDLALPALGAPAATQPDYRALLPLCQAWLLGGWQAAAEGDPAAGAAALLEVARFGARLEAAAGDMAALGMALHLQREALSQLAALRAEYPPPPEALAATASGLAALSDRPSTTPRILQAECLRLTTEQGPGGDLCFLMSAAAGVPPADRSWPEPPQASSSGPGAASFSRLRSLALSASALVEEGDAVTARYAGLRTAIAADRYEADRGEPILALDELVPDYLPEVPVDPYTGAPLVLDGYIKAACPPRAPLSWGLVSVSGASR